MTTLPIVNTQPPERQELDPSGDLDIVGVWYTLQGEGPFAGHPAVFVRLAGCSILCSGCDTDYTTGRHKASLAELLLEIDQVASKHCKLLVITGGEPLRQNIVPLVNEILADDWYVQIETNGTLYVEGLPFANPNFVVVCSPKTGSINKRLEPFVNCYKYVVTEGKVDPVDGMPTECLGEEIRVARPRPTFGGLVYVQPIDVGDPEENARHAKFAAQLCLKYGYTLTLQQHKIVGLE